MCFNQVLDALLRCFSKLLLPYLTWSYNTLSVFWLIHFVMGGWVGSKHPKLSETFILYWWRHFWSVRGLKHVTGHLCFSFKGTSLIWISKFFIWCLLPFFNNLSYYGWASLLQILSLEDIFVNLLLIKKKFISLTKM